MTVSKDKCRALVSYVCVLAKPNAKSRFLRLKGLEPDRKYEVRGKIYTGNILMNAGIKIESRQGDFRSEQIEINEPDGEPVCDG